MPKREIIGDRIQLYRTEEERKPILSRLSRIEGQVRGLQRMIEDDRYCLDELQQINAISAALREVAKLILSQHIREGIRAAVEEKEMGVALDDTLRVLEAALKG